MTTVVPVEVKHTLRDLRVRKGLTQAEAAKALGVTEPTIRSWEKDSSGVSYKMIEKIESVYSIPQDYIFFGSNNAFSEKIKSA